MNKSLVAIILAIGAVPSSGCGTVCNLAGGALHPDKEPRVYGGVLRDIEVLDKAVSAGQQGKSIGDSEIAVYFIALAAIDPVLSFVGDTLTLPLTVCIQNKRNAAAASHTRSGNRSGSGVTLGMPNSCDPNDVENQ